jgi:methylenetetrahydrofolate dehydrogenase (NADP+)/methenyltetrahydrofolate cyclohydrolase
MAHIIDGKLVSTETRENIKLKVEEFYKRNGYHPSLEVIVVGNNPASTVYVNNKEKACKEVGIYSVITHYPEDITEQELLDHIYWLNNSNLIDGILVQLPLPKHISEKKIASTISPLKDVDAFHPENVGKIFLGNYDFLPCTPAGIIRLLKYYKVEISGKRCVVIGRSNIVGKPMAHLLLERNGTVTVCHSKTPNLAEITKQADILIVAVGKPNFVTADMVKPDAVVIDVGINRDENGKLVGDVDFNSVSEVASYITPVPGGVGLMTVAMLLENTLKAAEIQVNNLN